MAISNIGKQGPNACYVTLREVRFRLATALKRGRAPLSTMSFWFPHDRQYMNKVWKKSICGLF